MACSITNARIYLFLFSWYKISIPLIAIQYDCKVLSDKYMCSPSFFYVILTDICVKLQENYHHGQKLHSLLLKRVYATNCQLHVSEKWRQDHATVYTLPNLFHPVIIYFWLVQKTLWQDNLRIWQINFTFLKVAIMTKKLISRRWCLLEGHLCRIVGNHNNDYDL